MLPDRPCVLSFAGFDPSAGAGILADIKTFEAIGCYGLGICSGLTVQNDIHFEKVEWTPLELMEAQFNLLKDRFKIACVKIGLIENVESLKKVLGFLKRHDQNIKIICDPILKASAGFDFKQEWHGESLRIICESLCLLTPNRDEIKILMPEMEEEQGAEELSIHCAVLLKGGHLNGPDATDLLFENKIRTKYAAKKILNGAKHGSGCVLSAAIAGFLAQGNTLQEACQLGRNYMNAYLSSTTNLLGYHYSNQELNVH
jgi:hydroxymethylpyrimidine/phosphomethylpyrimidine kinase